MPLKDRWQVKVLGRRRRRKRRTQLLDDLRNRRRYWELNEETEDRKRWKRQFFIRTYGISKSYIP